MGNVTLNVFAGDRRVGTLARSDSEEDSFLFDYVEGSRGQDAVSLLMPVERDQIASTGGLLPIFEMNLPEGSLRERLRLLFAKAVPNLDDLELLDIVGGSQIGRLRYARSDSIPAEIPYRSLKEILAYRGAEDLFKDLLERYATYSGISGLQPKVLLRALKSRPPRTTYRGATHIIKAFDAREYSELAANEFFCLRAAAHAGMTVPNVQLSENRRFLTVERFDLRPDGEYLGVEDFCVLDGRRAHDRYDGSYEDVVRRMKQFVSPQAQRAAMEQFFMTLALSCAVENGDAHRKNFAVTYMHADGQVDLAPVYDVVCTTVYTPRDILALTLNDSKQFPERKPLLAFGRTRCGLQSRKCAELLGRVLGGVTTAIDDIRKFTRQNRDFGAMSKILIKAFERGRARLALA